VNRFLQHSEETRKDTFNETATRIGLPSYVIEKDFWVCFLLDLIFNRLDIEMDFMFKGGTSLSKCYKLINRFSEDIDLSLLRDSLGFSGKNAPETAPSRTQAERRIREVKQSGIEFVRDQLHPALYKLICDNLGIKNISLEINPDNGEDIFFNYPRVLSEENYSELEYILPRVQIETGTKSTFLRTEITSIKSYVAENFEKLFDTPAFDVNALKPDRTFWEKVTAIHALNNRNDPERIGNRISRHIYDIHEISKSENGKDILANTRLLHEVARHKALYFRDGRADYESAGDGELNLIPSDEIIEAYKTDYGMMTDLFFSGFEPPEFDDLIATLKHIQDVVK